MTANTVKATQKIPPPACNTGVEKKSLSQRIHWLEVTFKSEKHKKLPASLPQEGIECYPLHGYNAGLKFSDGRMEFTHTTRPDMGLHIQWDGASLDALTITPLELVQFLSKTDARFTRIDLAVDAQNHNLKPEDATNEIRAKRYKCRSKKNPCWFDPTFGGWTQYCGTKASEIHLRIYDKAAELGIRSDYTRVELVVRGKRAQAAASAIVSGTDYRSLVAGYVDFPEWKEWREIMVADAVALPAEKKTTATDLWLLNQCAKTLARRLDELGDDDLWFKFLDQVRENRKVCRQVDTV
jgi:hypothetical protein